MKTCKNFARRLAPAPRDAPFFARVLRVSKMAEPGTRRRHGRRISRQILLFTFITQLARGLDGAVGRDVNGGGFDQRQRSTELKGADFGKEMCDDSKLLMKYNFRGRKSLFE